MTFLQLANFVRIAELASLTKAAAVIRIAQPALSRQVRNLEAELGADLLVRHGWGVSLTDAGELLLTHARQILRDVDKAREAVDALASAPTGRIAIGVPATLADILLPPLAVALRDKHPRLKPRFVDDFSTGLHDRIQTGELDLALLYAERGLAPLPARLILSERLHLVCPTGSARTAQEVLANAPVILSARPSRLRSIVDRILADQQVRDPAILEVDSLPAIVGMVARGVGCTILPYSTVAAEVERGELMLLPLHGDQAIRTLLLARTRDRPPSSATRAVERELRLIVADLAGRFGWEAAPTAESPADVAEA